MEFLNNFYIIYYDLTAAGPHYIINRIPAVAGTPYELLLVPVLSTGSRSTIISEPVNYAPTKVGGLWGVAQVLKIHDHIPQLIQIQQTR